MHSELKFRQQKDHWTVCIWSEHVIQRYVLFVRIEELYDVLIMPLNLIRDMMFSTFRQSMVLLSLT